VVAGTKLTKQSGQVTITKAGTVLQNVELTGCITVQAKNVTITNVLIHNNGCMWLIRANQGLSANLTISHVEIDGRNQASNDAGIACSNCAVSYSNIYGTIDGIKADDHVTVTDSYIHDLPYLNASHNDGIQTMGTTQLTINHNTIVVGRQANSAVILSTGSSGAMGIHNVTISDNFLGGGSFTVFGGYKAGADVLSRVSNISVVNNEFTTQMQAKGGYYGPITSADAPVVVKGNTWADGANAGRAAQ